MKKAHTRGTDLRLPKFTHGALTLGLGQTKDATVQAAMRLRQLGTTQSVTFMAFPEVHQSIIDTCGKSWESKIDSADVIEWLLENTCDSIEQLQPLYYAQGMDFCERMQATLNHSAIRIDADQRSSFIEQILRQEKHTLSELYGPRAKLRPATRLASILDPRLAKYARELEKVRKDFQDSGKAVHASALQEVEQEREVTVEVESVRQVKKPPKFRPFIFPGLHKDLECLVMTGKMPPGAPGGSTFIPAIDALARSVAGRKYYVRCADRDIKLYVTAEFQKTVRMAGTESNDNYLRPVRYILWCQRLCKAVIITPEEAEAILHMEAGLGKNAIHVLLYAAPATRRMMQFNSLDFWAFPSLPRGWNAPAWLKIEVGIFAGRLYFEWCEYGDLCRFLGLTATRETLRASRHSDENERSTQANTSDPSSPQPDTSLPKHRLLASNIEAFLNQWLTNRRKGQEVAHTPMGYVAQGKPLDSTHPFFRDSSSTSSQGTTQMLPFSLTAEEDDSGNHNEIGYDEIHYEVGDSEDDVEETREDIDEYEG